MNDITFHGDSWDQYRYWQSQDKKTLKKINDLLSYIQRNGPMNGIGKPEKLKNHPGYSRRIDDKNRLVYGIDELNNIQVVSCRGHYRE